MAASDAFSDLEAFVRERMRLAQVDKAAFERDGQRLNSQVMQGELNMGAAVIAWIERMRQGAPAAEVADEVEDADEPDASGGA